MLYDAEHMAYYDSAGGEARRRIDLVEAALLRADAASAVPARFRLLLSGASDSVKAEAARRCSAVFQPDNGSSERSKQSRWLDALLRIPFGVVLPTPVRYGDDPGRVAEFLREVRGRLDGLVYGHPEAKRAVLSTMGKWVSNPRGSGVVLGIRGPVGCGKTTLARRCIADAMGLPMVTVPLGGACDAAALLGHHVTYEGSTHGSVAGALMQAGCMNPVILFDEVDKVAGGARGQEVVSVLIHLTDASQNDDFHDSYFAGIPIDLSRAICVFTYNDASEVSPILLDRMTCIETSGYTVREKQVIAERHLLPAACAEFGFEPGAVAVSPDVVAHIARLGPPEEGVRGLQRSLASIVSGVNMQRLLGEGPSASPTAAAPLHVTRELAEQLMPARPALPAAGLAHIYT